MSKTIYYLGAGSSFGRRDESGGILEGLPIVSEIPSQFDAFRDYIAKAEVPPEGVVFQQLYRTRASDIENEKKYMLADIDSLKDKSREHATIDTYARKLYLTGDFRAFAKLKDIQRAFFVWKPMHKQPCYKGVPCYLNGVSEALFKVGMCLPAGPYVSDDDVRYIVETIKGAIEK